MVVWHVRSAFEDFDPALDYEHVDDVDALNRTEDDATLFTLQINHGGYFARHNVDMNEEWVGGGEQEEEHGEEVDDEAAHIDHDDFESGTDSENNNPRRKALRRLRRERQRDLVGISERQTVTFYAGQLFPNKEMVKQQIFVHAVESRRQFHIIRNDKIRLRVIYKGSIPQFENDGSINAKSILPNPNIPIKALQHQVQKKYELHVSEPKIFRAKVLATKKIQGDYSNQYALLRDYCLELQATNIGTTLKIDVDPCCDPASPTRMFRRIYICLGALKRGFVMGMRELLGLDGCFMKGPWPGQILTTVGVDANNGIYLVAYAILEAENTSSWTWFLECLGDDLDLDSRSNFTFISDRQKGIIPALAKTYPSAEHRYCLRHIHENMKQSWKGNLYKDFLWRAATATTIPQFQLIMEELRKFNQGAYDWLIAIPPRHWSRSHFTGRSKCDVLLNNLCEVFNKQLVDGRDKPIITCLEYIREYIMRKIVNVQKVIDKSGGPLTPTATRVFNNIKSAAAKCSVSWNSLNKFQVSEHEEQYVVDVQQKVCSCRKWELTGIPCKHAVASIWNMANNGQAVGIPETWVASCYWLDTWKRVYMNKIDPINGRQLWPKSPCPTTLLPPKHHTPIGRPKKKRKKSSDELRQSTKKGHNKKTCKGQDAATSTAKGKDKVSSKLTGNGKGSAKAKEKMVTN
ncbi:hypothetical protein L1987_36880 [Smallanthus sonchifolius]|uniref:Uncharacterized protein n=1 Tax=Smallanthus sonchifolius TaxID=185202 RepID=A0ACB9HG24_9ASTR|nr:hypothetical protein L1987_36880 [Smallanthus sonchifolius]